MAAIFLIFIIINFLQPYFQYKEIALWIFEILFSFCIIYLFISSNVIKYPYFYLFFGPLIFVLPVDVFILNIDSEIFTISEILVASLIFLISYFLSNLLPKYMLEKINDRAIPFLMLFSVLSLLVSFDKQCFFELKLFELVVSLTSIGAIDFFRTRKNQTIAEKYFREELLSNEPSYKKLIQCYGKGGASYKEKILSNEKFLRIIEQEENIN